MEGLLGKRVIRDHAITCADPHSFVMALDLVQCGAITRLSYRFERPTNFDI